MKYYKSKTTGKCITSANISSIQDIMGGDYIENIVYPNLIELENPTVIDILKMGNKVAAYYRYYEIHNCKSVSIAMKMVSAIEKDMK